MYIILTAAVFGSFLMSAAALVFLYYVRKDMEEMQGGIYCLMDMTDAQLQSGGCCGGECGCSDEDAEELKSAVRH